MDYVCDRCNGEGIIPPNINDEYVATCPKCFGSKKLNWLENIFGKKQDFITVSFNLDAMNKYTKSPILKEIVDKMSEQIALDIDKEILNSLIKELKR